MPVVINLPQVITDKFGADYRLDRSINASQWVLRIRAPKGGGEIGHAYCVADGKVLRLMDLHIREDFRRQGLGSALLKAVVEAARFHFKQIKGVMQEGDLEEYPGLPDWYVRNGFDVESTNTPIAFSKVVWPKPQPGAVAPTRTEMEAAIREWTRKHSFIRKVWLYGSRISGISSNTGTAPKADTDWDVAVEVSGANQRERYDRWIAFMDQAGDEMNALTNWKIDVQHCDLEFHADSNVATAVKKYGALVYEHL